MRVILQLINIISHLASLLSCNLRYGLYVCEMKHLKEAFRIALIKENIDIKTFAAQRDINPGRISEFLHRNGRLAGRLREVIFNGWAADKTQIDLFNAYMKDEIEACGLTGLVKATCYNDREYDLDDN